MIVYKLWGECYEICEHPEVYKTRTDALLAAKEYEDFWGMSVEEALECGELDLIEYTLVGVPDE